MTEQYKELRESYEVEEAAIEDVFIKERKELLERNRKELEALFKRREDMEARFFEDRLATESKYQQEVGGGSLFFSTLYNDSNGSLLWSRLMR